MLLLIWDQRLGHFSQMLLDVLGILSRKGKTNPLQNVCFMYYVEHLKTMEAHFHHLTKKKNIY